MSFEIVFIVLIRCIVPQICWWISQLEVRLDLVNSNIMALYWTSFQVGIAIGIVLKENIFHILHMYFISLKIPHVVCILDD